MNPKLTPEQSAALHQKPDEPLRVIDPSTNQVCFIFTEQAIELREVMAGLQESIAQADAGETIPLEDADRAIREKLGFPKAS